MINNSYRISTAIIVNVTGQRVEENPVGKDVPEQLFCICWRK